jgi:hypothetical protein
LTKLPEVKALRLQGSELSIEILEERPAKERVLSLLSSKNVDVRGFQVQEANLASAYFRLTGVRPEEEPRPLPGGARGGRTADREVAL